MNVTLALILVSGILKLDALGVAKAVWKLGAGRSKADEDIDYRVGIRLLHVEGDKVKIGEGLMEVHHNSSELSADIHKQIEEAIVISGVETVQSLIIDIITA